MFPSSTRRGTIGAWTIVGLLIIAGIAAAIYSQSAQSSADGYNADLRFLEREGLREEAYAVVLNEATTFVIDSYDSALALDQRGLQERSAGLETLQRIRLELLASGENDSRSLEVVDALDEIVVVWATPPVQNATIAAFVRLDALDHLVDAGLDPARSEGSIVDAIRNLNGPEGAGLDAVSLYFDGLYSIDAYDDLPLDIRHQLEWAATNIVPEAPPSNLAGLLDLDGFEAAQAGAADALSPLLLTEAGRTLAEATAWAVSPTAPAPIFWLDVLKAGNAFAADGLKSYDVFIDQAYASASDEASSAVRVRRGFALLALILVIAATVFASVIVTRSRRSTQALELAAQSDPLTELLNLRGFKAAIRQRWPDELISHSAVLQLDMDYLKRLNDSLGHAVGDKAIVCVAEAIRKSARDGEGDIAARIGGDEFVVIVVSKVPLEAARRVARRVVEQLAGVTSIDDMPVSLRISFGISCAVEPTPIEEVLRAADNDMLTAKSTRAAVVPQDSALS